MRHETQHERDSPQAARCSSCVLPLSILRSPALSISTFIGKDRSRDPYDLLHHCHAYSNLSQNKLRTSAALKGRNSPRCCNVPIPIVALALPCLLGGGGPESSSGRSSEHTSWTKQPTSPGKGPSSPFRFASATSSVWNEWFHKKAFPRRRRQCNTTSSTFIGFSSASSAEDIYGFSVGSVFNSTADDDKDGTRSRSRSAAAMTPLRLIPATQ